MGTASCHTERINQAQPARSDGLRDKFDERRAAKRYRKAQRRAIAAAQAAYRDGSLMEGAPRRSMRRSA